MTRNPIDFSRLPPDVDKPRFEVSAVLKGHIDDVRALACDRDSRLYSASRDGSVRQWTRLDRDGIASWQTTLILQGDHEGFVNSVAWLPSSSGEQGYLVTGGQDTVIQVYDLEQTQRQDSPAPLPSHTLLGHMHNVCSLHGSADGKRIISGSWDCTARVWSTETWSTDFVLTDHEAAVWDVLAVDVAKYEDNYITACADGLVRQFKKGMRTNLFKGHRGPVRALAKILPDDPEGHLFASASNDGTIRIWSLEGDAITVLDGHPDSFIYSLSSILTNLGGGLASSGEDGLVKIWNDEDGEEEQTIDVPALSVWSVLALNTGDLCCACSDNLIWIFTRHSERLADAATQNEYEATLAELKSSRVKSASGVTPMVHGEDSLKEPGSADGQVKLVRHSDGQVHAYTWAIEASTWDDVGEVVTAHSAPENNTSAQQEKARSAPRMQHEGVEYDYVFAIDVADDQPAIKLPYNLEQDAHEVARQFVETRHLPESYVERIVQFIRASTS
ncbi:hypothetical protein OIO90_000134 [Microbotryomycetes sp. JL221]|nr:hypothetical protein OIO90_000134 [Microbotryomycetes sp. JL221]